MAAKLTTKGSFPESELDLIRNLTIACKFQGMMIRQLWGEMAEMGLPVPMWVFNAAQASTALVEAAAIRIGLEDGSLLEQMTDPNEGGEENLDSDPQA